MRKSLGRNVSRGRRDSLQPANGEVFRLLGSLYPKRRVLSDDCKRGWICRLEGGENPTTVETLTCTSRDFKMPRRPRRQERQKSNRLNRQNNNSARASRFSAEVSFSFWTWIWFLAIRLKNEFVCIWRSKWVGVIVIEIERTQIHFWIDVFVAVAVAVAVVVS